MQDELVLFFALAASVALAIAVAWSFSPDEPDDE